MLQRSLSLAWTVSWKGSQVADAPCCVFACCVVPRDQFWPLGNAAKELITGVDGEYLGLLQSTTWLVWRMLQTGPAVDGGSLAACAFCNTAVHLVPHVRAATRSSADLQAATLIVTLQKPKRSARGRRRRSSRQLQKQQAHKSSQRGSSSKPPHGAVKQAAQGAPFQLPFSDMTSWRVDVQAVVTIVAHAAILLGQDAVS
jgi:hypothetical protein